MFISLVPRAPWDKLQAHRAVVLDKLKKDGCTLDGILVCADKSIYASPQRKLLITFVKGISDSVRSSFSTVRPRIVVSLCTACGDLLGLIALFVEILVQMVAITLLNPLPEVI